jgi:hypothetical protein
MDPIKIFEFLLDTKHYYQLMEISIGRREILEVTLNLYSIAAIDHFLYDRIRNEENIYKEKQKKYNENVNKALFYFSNLLKNNQTSKILEENNKNFRKLIEDFLKINFDFEKYNLDEIKFICFGSHSNGFATKNSDIDAIILTNNYLG